MFLNNRRSIFSYISCTVICLFVAFKSSFLTPVLEHNFGIEQFWHGWILAIPAICYVFSAAVVGYIIDYAPRRIFLLVTFVVMLASLILMGPSYLLHLPKQVWIFFIGFGLNGIAQGFLFIPILPEVIDAIYQKNGIIEGEDEYIDGIISDKAAGLYGSFYSLGVISAPLLGSLAYELTNENWYQTCDVFAIICASYIVIFFLGNVLPDIHKDRKEKEAMIEKQMKSDIIIEKALGMTPVKETDEDMTLGGIDFKKTEIIDISLEDEPKQKLLTPGYQYK